VDGCTAEEYCRRNPTLERCKCILDPASCRYNIAPREVNTCTTADQRDKTNLRCFCAFNTGRECFDNKGEQRPDNEDTRDPNRFTGAIEVTPRPECREDPSKCSDRITPRGRGGRVDLESAGVTSFIDVDGPNVDVDRRRPDGSPDGGFAAGMRAVELLEVKDDGDCRLSDGDTIVSRFNLLRATWTSTFSTNRDGTTFYTITVTESTGRFTFTFVVASDEYNVAGRVIKIGARFTMEIRYPWQSTDTKLFIVFKLVLCGGVTAAPVLAGGSTINIYGAGSTNIIGTATLDLVGRVGTGDVRFNIGWQGETTAVDVQNTDLRVGTGCRVYTVFACLDVLGTPDRVVYDPQLNPGDYTPPGTNGAVAAQPQFILALLAALLAAVLRF
jgi:hypothetical protein